MDPYVRALLDKLPMFDPAWSKDIRDQWFDCIGRLMRLAEPPLCPCQRNAEEHIRILTTVWRDA